MGNLGFFKRISRGDRPPILFRGILGVPLEPVQDNLDLS